MRRVHEAKGMELNTCLQAELRALSDQHRREREETSRELRAYVQRLQEVEDEQRRQASAAWDWDSNAYTKMSIPVLIIEPSYVYLFSSPNAANILKTGRE